MGGIKYPITVKKIKIEPLYQDMNQPNKPGGMHTTGELVSIRPCADEYGGKTYVGIFLGELPISLSAFYNKETEELELMGYDNPAIFVPALGKIIWGCESWWGSIKNPEDLRQITDEDIDNVWYVKALKEM